MMFALLLFAQESPPPAVIQPPAGPYGMPSPEAVAQRIVDQVAAAPAVGVVAPRSVYMPPVDRFYPASSLRAEEQGTVRLRCTLGVTGELRDCALDQGSGFAALDSASFELARWARYSPRIVDRAPVESKVVLPVRWVIAD
jgi:periplasmic protein TonB